MIVVITILAWLVTVVMLFRQRSRFKKELERAQWPGGHPEDRLRARSVAPKSTSVEEAAADYNNAFPPHLDWLQENQEPPPTFKRVDLDLPDSLSGNGIDMIFVEPPKPVEDETEPLRPAQEDIVSKPAPILPIWHRFPHIMPFLFAVSMLAVWYGCASWYNNLSRYIVPAADTLGDFRVLYLKKAVGAVLPCLSSLVASLGLLFVLNYKFYYYINGWTAKDFDFSTDMRNLNDTGALRRVLVFATLFALFFVAFLYFFTLSPQEMTL